MTNSLIQPADIEKETNFPVEAIRKWRSRYGWPVPLSEGRVTGYTREQAAQLRLINRLLNAGFRPIQIVGKPLSELEKLATAIASAVSDEQWSPFTRASIDLLRKHDLESLEDHLQTEMDKVGLANFARSHVAPLAVALGEAWARGDIEVHQEHLCTSLLIRILQASIHALKPLRQGKRVLLATPPDEQHILGLLMVQAVLTEARIQCIMLGASVPIIEIPKAAAHCNASVLALSFSFSYPVRKITPLIEDLRAKIDSSCEIWIGGAATRSVKGLKMNGVRIFKDLNMPVSELT